MTSSRPNDEIIKLRDVLFPAIGVQIITGFNVYKTKEKAKDSNPHIARISYLYEDSEEGVMHYDQIENMLRKYCNQIMTQKIKHEDVSRFGSYRVEEGWRAKEYFLIDQTHVKEDDIGDFIKKDITVIGCGLQNELIIECDKNDLSHILEQFRL